MGRISHFKMRTRGNSPKARPAARPLYTGAYICTGRLSLSSISTSESSPCSRSTLCLLGDDGGVVTKPIFLPYQLRLTLMRVCKEGVDDLFSGSLNPVVASSEDGGVLAAGFSTKGFVWEDLEFAMEDLGSCFPEPVTDAGRVGAICKASTLPAALELILGEWCEACVEGAAGRVRHRSLMRRSSKSLQVGMMRSRDSDQMTRTRSSRCKY